MCDVVKPRRRLILMQGKPGCGKSTVAEAIEYLLTDTDPDDGSRRPVGSCRRLSSDTYLYNGSEYEYTPERQARAHQLTRRDASIAMFEDMELIIIDNTNLKLQWCQAYINLAEQFHYDVQVVRVDAQPGLQCIQNEMRTPDRKVPLEFFRDLVPEDLLYLPSTYSWRARFKEAWRWIRPFSNRK